MTDLTTERIRTDGATPGSDVYGSLREANIARQAAWCPEQVPDLSFRGNELAGETGEVCNVIKKLERERLGWRGSRDTVEHLAEELADVVICADLCAISAGIDLDVAVEAKFNATSEKVGLPQRLTLAAPAPGGRIGAVEVKPLEWTQNWPNDPETAFARADHINRTYTVDHDGPRFYVSTEVSLSSAGADNIGNFATFKAAKTAAQKDYEHRILSALAASPPASVPPAPVGVTEEMVEAAAKAIWELADDEVGWALSKDNPTVSLAVEWTQQEARAALEAALAASQAAPRDEVHEEAAKDTERAIAAWNRRTPSPATGEAAELVKRLEAAAKFIEWTDVGEPTGPEDTLALRSPAQVLREAAAELLSLQAERDEALDRVEELEAQGEQVSEEFERDCWKAMRSLLNLCKFDWGYADDGVTAEDAREHVAETFRQLEASEARTRANLTAAQATIAQLREALELADVARERLDRFANEANAGHVEAGGRELKRKIWAAFSDYDEARSALKEGGNG